MDILYNCLFPAKEIRYGLALIRKKKLLQIPPLQVIFPIDAAGENCNCLYMGQARG